MNSRRCQFKVFCSSIINNIGFTFVVGYLEDIQQMLTSLRWSWLTMNLFRALRNLRRLLRKFKGRYWVDRYTHIYFSFPAFFFSCLLILIYITMLAFFVTECIHFLLFCNLLEQLKWAKKNLIYILDTKNSFSVLTSLTG